MAKKPELSTSKELQDLSPIVASTDVDQLLAELDGESEAAHPDPVKVESAKTAAKEATSDEKAPEVKVEKKKRVLFNKQSERILHNLGDKTGDFMLLELKDAELTGDKLKERNKEVLALIDAIPAKKVGEKALQLFKWMHNGGDMNEVMRRAFTLLAKDSQLESGDKGNLQTDLLKKPYSVGTARSQSNQMFMLMPALKITIKEKGRMVANPDSLILMKVNSILGL
jgi:hypothetical protein